MENVNTERKKSTKKQWKTHKNKTYDKNQNQILEWHHCASPDLCTTATALWYATTRSNTGI